MLGAAVAGPALGALIGAAATRFTDPHGPFLTVFARWWTGDALGVLIVGRLIVAWLTRTGSPIRPRYAPGEAVAAGGAARRWSPGWRSGLAPGLAYLALLPLGWAAIRFGARGGAAVAARRLAVRASGAPVTDHGLFAVISGNDDSGGVVLAAVPGRRGLWVG